jgi:SAM-dependent methyltransferase
MKQFLRRWGEASHKRNVTRCYDWSGEQTALLRPQALLDVGCGDGSFLSKYLKETPKLFCGIEAAPILRQKALERGIKVVPADLNGPWPYEANMFDVVHCSQVIEHLHNTRMFVSELFRVLKPGGTALVTSENLTSFLNLGAMALGYTPFSLMRTCGWYVGNPLGLHSGEDIPDGVPVTDPAFAGVTGHIRVLSVLQAEEFFERLGFQAEVFSMGLMPLPDWIGWRLEKFMPRRGHFLLIRAKKPLIAPRAA